MKQVEVVKRQHKQPTTQEQNIVLIWNVSRILLTLGVVGAYLIHSA